MFNPQAIFFDLDGTLVDSVGDLAWAVGRMMENLGKPDPGKEKVLTWVGNGAPKLIKRALTGTMDGEPDEQEFDRATALFKSHYRANLAVHSQLYPGVRDTLNSIAQSQLPLVCITNKPAEFTHQLLAKLDIGELFSETISGDTLANKKPHPEPLLHAAKLCDTPIAQCLMVGDSKSDVLAAFSAGCPVVAVSYGYNHGEDIRLSKPDITIDRFDQLLSLIQLDGIHISV